MAGTPTILSGLTTSFTDQREQVVYEMATCLAHARWVSQGLYERAVEALGHVGITDVIVLMGSYTQPFQGHIIFPSLRTRAVATCR
jgi:4-carboxymuconolactone decarboxylase